MTYELTTNYMTKEEFVKIRSIYSPQPAAINILIRPTNCFMWVRLKT